jgi:ribosomal protein S18 acetylase RimI-like enzyme
VASFLTSRSESRQPPPYAVREWDGQMFARRLDELLTVYLAAMRYPNLSLEFRRPVWMEHSFRPAFTCRVAINNREEVVGLCYGYRGIESQWWSSEVRRGMTSEQMARWMTEYRELTELHVRPDCQGSGIGESLLRSFLGAAKESTVLLSTPEGDNRAWRLYRRLGFVDVLRHHRFTGDVRPFAILGRDLPLDA